MVVDLYPSYTHAPAHRFFLRCEEEMRRDRTLMVRQIYHVGRGVDDTPMRCVVIVAVDVIFLLHCGNIPSKVEVFMGDIATFANQLI